MNFITICLVLLQLNFIHSQTEELMGLNWGKIAIKVIDVRLTHASAEKYCLDRNTRLFTGFLLQHKFLNNALFNNLPQGDQYWAGVKRQTSTSKFEWMMAYEQEGSPAISSTDANKNCGAVSLVNDEVKYEARDCNELRPFICEKHADPCSSSNLNPFLIPGPYNTVFSRPNVSVIFSEAYTYCKIMGSQLAAIMFPLENDFVKELSRTTDRTQQGIWLGGHKIGDTIWSWYDNTPICSNNFALFSFQSTTDLTNQMVMWTNQASFYNRNKEHGLWSFADRNEKQGIICQKRCRYTPSSCNVLY